MFVMQSALTSYLDRFTPHWLGALMHPCLSIPSSTSPEISAQQLQAAIGKSYKKINLSWCKGLSEVDIINLIKNTPDLEEIYLSEIPISDAVLVALQENCPRLKIFAHHQASYINDSDVYWLSGKIREKIQRGESLENSENLPGWEEAVKLIGQEERLFTPKGIDSISKMSLEKLMIYFHPRIDHDQLLPLLGRVKEIYLPSQRSDKWDERMKEWFAKGTLVRTGNEIGSG